MEPKTKELSRVVVEFESFVRRNTENGQDLYPIGVETVVAITQDQDIETGKITWTCISGFSWWYSTIDQICQDRACRVESGELLPGGIRMKAEVYLGQWRQAKLWAISFGQMIERGLLLVATVSQPTAFCKDTQASAEDRDKDFVARLTSPHIVKADDHATVWRIPINSLANLRDYIAVNRWHDQEKYPGEFSRSLDIEHVLPTTSTAQAAIPLATDVASQQFELFTEAA